ncbi:MAG TPA: ATP-dependent helicase HrpB [Cellvibrionaceae bacterium]
MTPELPIAPLLPELIAKLFHSHQLILQAPPGAGKTTQVPLHLLKAPWLGDKKIIMLEPRRIAARSCAIYMAALLGEPVGATVGYRVRQDSQVSAKTRIEVVTGGVFLRMLQEDPSLESAGVIIFDEFHERQLDSDLALALSLYSQSLLREDDPLRLLVMSATLDTQGLEKLLPHAPVLTSKGRMFPVSIHYGKTLGPKEAMAEAVGATLVEAMNTYEGNALVFLPGQREIQACQQWLIGRLNSSIKVFPLYASLPSAQQQLALTPNESIRKAVLATNIAETSLTIDGITLVVDSGFCREAEFDPNTGLTRLNLKRISKASATQRAGRAGRLAAGHCLRLWSQELVMNEHSPAEILKADLAALALQLVTWGIEPAELTWLDTPPHSSYQQALELLQRLNAVQPGPKGGWQLTQSGKEISRLPVHPRLGHMLVESQNYGITQQACWLTAILTETLKGPAEADLSQLLEQMNDKKSHLPGAWRESIARQVKQFLQLLTPQSNSSALPYNQICGFLLACAYPDRIAKARTERRGVYQLANGRAASIDPLHPLSKHSWLVVAETQGASGRTEDHIVTAAPLDPELFKSALAGLISTQRQATWDKKLGRFIANEQQCIGAVIWQEKRLETLQAEDRQNLLMEFLQKEGLDYLNWDEQALQMRARLNYAFEQDPNCWPACDEASLLSTLGDWLKPYLSAINNLQQLQALNLSEILAVRLSWADHQQLNQLLPTHWEAPTGTKVAIDYTQSPPVLAVKLQEMFGTDVTPEVYQGRIKLALHLLSPARRPLQITQDLGGFWRSSYQEVKKEMKGRYPRHPWPDDPLSAPPQRGVKNPRKSF